MKRKLLLAALCVAGAVGMRAQTDVTATYLTNADFSSGTPIDNNVCTYGKDMVSNGTTYYGAQAIEGWTNASVGVKDEQDFENSGLAGGLFEYGSTPWLAGSGNPAPATDPSGNAGNAAGLCAVWGNSVQYTQDVTLPAGSYTVVFKVYNATSGSGNSSGVITTDLFGFVAGETTYYAPNNTFAIGQWSTIAVTFTLAAETEGKISMGYVGPSGGAAMPHLFVDNVKILANGMAEDCTNKVSTSGWTGASDGYQGGTINTARQYGDKSIGRHIYQTVSGLDKGSYEVTLYAISQKEWNGTLANDAGDVAYVFAEGAYELKEWINARARAAYPGDDNVGIYTISDVKVTDGTLTLGIGLAQANLTEWHHVQIKSLIKTNNPDLSDYITAWESALAAAKAFDQTQTMSATWKAALNTAISTYDDGLVDDEDQDALETATAALKDALAKAEASVASYAVIATGSIPDNSLTGWVCENSNTFHINTWSGEGNSDGSNMKTPFIENWVGKGSYLGAGKVYYQLAGLEPGEVYYAQALVRSYNEANSDAPNGPNFFINDVVTSLSTAGTTFTYNNMSGIYATLGGAATVGEDGILKLGVEIAADRNYNWVAFKSVSIQSMDDAFDAAVAKVTALEGTIPTAAYNAAYAVVTTNSGDNYPTTAAGFETAIAAIEAAATSAAAMQKPYANWNTQKAIVEHNVATSTDNESARTTLSDALSTQSTAIENATTVEGINNVISALKTANYTYAQVATPTTEGDYIDCTTMLTNPDVTELSGNAGWKTEQEGGNFGVTTNAHREGYATAYSIEYWSETAQANDKFSLYDEVTLPAGTYEMSCYAFASPNNVAGATNNAVYFYANDTQGSLISSTDLEEATLSFVNASEQAVKIGLKTLTGNQYRWMGIGYVKLYKVPAQTYTVDETVAYDYSQSGAGAVTLNRTIKAGYNSVVLPFSMTQEEVESTFGTDSKVYVVSKYENENLSFVTQSGITPNRPCLLYATEAGTSYEIEDRTIVAAASAAPSYTSNNATMTGSYAASITVDNGNYVLAKNELHLVDSSVSLKNTRAYITLTEAEGAKARVITMSFDDSEATGIATIKNGTISIETGTIYNLNGQRVAAPTKGIYIVNGKKVLFK